MLLGVLWAGFWLLVFAVSGCLCAGFGSVFFGSSCGCCLAHLLPAGLLGVEKQIDNFPLLFVTFVFEKVLLYLPSASISSII
jgi:hypothetical protein